MRPAIGFGVLFLTLLMTPRSAPASGWFLTADGAVGKANQETKFSDGTISYENLDVFRVAAGGGYLLANNLSGTLEIAMSKRGGRTENTTVFHPDGDGTFFQMDRTYLDVASTWSFRIRSGQLTAGAGLSPRVSFFVAESELGFSPLKPRVIPGVDPLVFLGYRGFHVSGRYVLDLGPAYKVSGDLGTSRVLDSSFFIGVGFDLPI